MKNTEILVTQKAPQPPSEKLAQKQDARTSSFCYLRYKFRQGSSWGVFCSSSTASKSTNTGRSSRFPSSSSAGGVAMVRGCCSASLCGSMIACRFCSCDGVLLLRRPLGPFDAVFSPSPLASRSLATTSFFPASVVLLAAAAAAAAVPFLLTSRGSGGGGGGGSVSASHWSVDDPISKD